MEKSQFWTITATFSVCAGDMEKDEVINQAQSILESLIDGSDISGFTVTDAHVIISNKNTIL